MATPWMTARVSMSGWYQEVAGDPLHVMGWKREALMAAPRLDIGDPRDMETATAAYMAALDGSQQMRYVGRVLGQDGQPRWVDARIQRDDDPRTKTPSFVVAFKPALPPTLDQAFVEILA